MSAQKKNVAIMISSLNGGGAQRSASLLSRVLTNTYNIFFFVLRSDEISFKYRGNIVHLCTDDDSSIEEIIINNKKKYKIDVSISFMESTNFLNVMTCCGERVIISERCTPSKRFEKNSNYSCMIKKYYNYADLVISCSEGVKSDLINEFGVLPEKMHTIYNFIDFEEVRLKNKTELDRDFLSFVAGKKYFINVGRLVDVKNQKRLIKQFSYFAKSRDDYKLAIFGNGEEKEALNDLILKCDCYGKIKIFSFSSNVHAYMSCAEALLLTSKSEGFPNVILEAMALECPVISTDCISGPREMLNDETNYYIEYQPVEICKRGIIVTNNETEDCSTTYFSEALNLLTSDGFDINSMKKNMSNYISEYSNEIIASQWIEKIEDTKRRCPLYLYKNEVDKYREREVYIYGAGIIAMRLYDKLKNVHTKIKAFVVSEDYENKSYIDNIPIINIEEFKKEMDADVVILVGVSAKYYKEVIKNIEELNCKYDVFWKL